MFSRIKRRLKVEDAKKTEKTREIDDFYVNTVSFLEDFFLLVTADA